MATGGLCSLWLILLGDRVKRLGSNIRAIRPDDRPQLSVEPNALEVVRVIQRFEQGSVLEEVGEIDIPDEAVLEAEADGPAVDIFDLDYASDFASHHAIVPRSRNGRTRADRRADANSGE